MSAEAPEPQSRLTITEVSMSLNGFDLKAVNKAFDKSIAVMQKEVEAGADGMELLYALIFVDKRRSGLSHDVAFKAAMEMPITEIGSYFPKEEIELDPDDPETEMGKGNSLPE